MLSGLTGCISHENPNTRPPIAPLSGFAVAVGIGIEITSIHFDPETRYRPRSPKERKSGFAVGIGIGIEITAIHSTPIPD